MFSVQLPVSNKTNIEVSGHKEFEDLVCVYITHVEVKAVYIVEDRQSSGPHHELWITRGSNKI